jgi:O-antigen/teichoic acid export membrane protein
LKLASSLVVSFGITLALRQLVIPRFLGTERLGELNFADGLAGVFLVAAWLGVDIWLRREMGLSLKSADGLFGGILAVRAVSSLFLTAALAVTLYLMGRSPEIILTGVVFGIAQLASMMQNTSSALLHAASKVGGLSVSNIVGRLIWAAIVVPALMWHASLVWVAGAFAISEVFKAIYATMLVRRHTGLKLTIDFAATKNALKGSLPFWVNNIALAGTGRADVTVLGTMCVSLLGSEAASNREVGWYTVVLGFGGMMMVIAPVIGWVLVPLLSRALKQSQEAAGTIIPRAVEVCVVLGMPLTVGAFVAAEQIMAPPFYRLEFAPAALVLKIMSVTYLATYINVVCANCLAALDRGWTVTFTSMAMLVMTPALDLLFIPYGVRLVGASGGAAACAVSLVLAEIITTGIMLKRLGHLAVDARLISVCIRTTITAGVVLALNYVLSTQGFHPWLRVGLDALVYVGVALLTGSVRVSEAVAFVKLARAQRAAGATA